MRGNSYQRILLVQTAYIGDLILTTPLIRAVRQLYPQSQIDVLVIPQTEEIVRFNPHINNVVIFDKRAKKLKAFRKTRGELLKQRYDLAISPHRSMTSALLLFMSKIPKRIGFRKGPGSLLWTDSLPYRTDVSEIRRNLNLLRVFTDQPFDVQTEIFWNGDIALKVEDEFKHVPDNHYCIAVAPGSVWPTKRWPEEHYAALVHALKDEHMSFFFIGSAEERDLCERIIHKSRTDTCHNLAGETNLLEASAIIQKCHLFVGNDNGAMHIANAVQTDVVAFFGPTSRTLGFYPFRENDRVFERDLDCRPCSIHGSKKCPLDHFQCLKELFPNEVVNYILDHRKANQERKSEISTDGTHPS